MSSTSTVSPVPPATGAFPYLTIRNAPAAIEFYEKVFGAQVKVRLDAPDGLMHAELNVGPAMFMLSEERPQYGALSPQSLNGSATTLVLYFADADAVYQRAIDAGAKSTMPMADQFWGDRSGSIVDPFGHNWMISKRLEEVGEPELKQRMEKMFSEGADPSAGQPG